MSHSRRELFYHLTWSTKYRISLITAEMKPVLLQFIKVKAAELKCMIYEHNCVSDHVHVLLYIPPSITVSKVINGLKGASSFMLKTYLPDFAWQQGYGIFTIRKDDIPIVRRYIKNQEQHHREGSINSSWEFSLDTE